MARADKVGAHRTAFEKNKRRIMQTQEVCAICGGVVDKSLKFPHPMSPCIDHIIPIDRGGHPSDIDNLQLAHLCCNRRKSNKIISEREQVKNETISNRLLPQSRDWTTYKGGRMTL